MSELGKSRGYDCTFYFLGCLRSWRGLRIGPRRLRLQFIVGRVVEGVYISSLHAEAKAFVVMKRVRNLSRAWGSLGVGFVECEEGRGSGDRG